MPKFVSNIDLSKNQLLNPVVHNLTADPSSPVEGQLYYNTTSHKPFIYNNTAFIDISGAGSVTTLSIVTANGVSGTVATATTTPAVTITLGAITPTSVAATGTLSGSNFSGTHSGSSSGTNTGDQTSVTGNAGTATTLQTARTINGVSFDGSSNITITSAAGTLTGTTLASNVVTSSLTSVGTLTSLAVTGNITAADPTSNTQVATKQYVDNLSNGLSWKTAVIAATTANITLSGTQTIDGVAVVAGQRVLVKNQTTASQNGIYIVNASTWTRSNDAATAAELDGAAVYVQQGTSQADTAWTETATVTTVGTDSVVWAQFAATGPAAAGALTGTTLASNVVNSSLTSVGTLTNLTVTNPISGSITGNAATVTTNANLTGDVTSSGNATTLATVNSNVGSFTNASITVDGKGRITAASNGTAALQKYSTNYGNGSATSFTITHNLGTRNVQVMVAEASGSYNVVIPDIQLATTNTITLVHTVAPTTNQYNVVVIG